MSRAVLALIALAACTPAPPQPATPPVDRLAAECALLARAADRMSAQGTPAHDGLREGCPGETRRDTRPLPQQTASLREAHGAALPPGAPATARADAVFRRMITRGVPVVLARELTLDPAFAAASR